MQQLQRDVGLGVGRRRDASAPRGSRPPACRRPRRRRTARARRRCATSSGRERPDRAQHLDALVADAVGLERDRRLHRGQRQQLEQVVLHHVAQRAGLLVVAAAAFDADRLGHRDLHVVDVAAVPDRLEDAVGEAEDHQVLDGLLAEVVIDAVDLRLVEGRGQLLVQRARRGEVAAERLLDDDPPPGRLVRSGTVPWLRPARARAPWRSGRTAPAAPPGRTARGRSADGRSSSALAGCS